MVAQFSGSHGVRGEYKLRSFTEDPESLFAYGPIRTEKGQVLNPKPVRELKPGLFLCRSGEISGPEDCDAFKGALLHVPRSALPDEGGEDDFYVEDLVGLRAYDTSGVSLGTVRAVPNYGAGDVVEIAGGNGLLLVPFTRDAVPEVDLEREQIVVVPPEDADPDAR